MIPNNGGRDYWGNLLTDSTPDIGAYEYPKITTNNVITVSSNNLSVYPDYSDSSMLIVNLNGLKLTEKVKIEIVSMDGKLVFSQNFTPQNNLKLKMLNRLISGQYIIKLHSVEIEESRKFAVR